MSNRLEELKQKIKENGGYFSLTADEKEEYKKLKAESEPQLAQLSLQAETTQKEDTVTISKAAFDEILARVARLEGNPNTAINKQTNTDWQPDGEEKRQFVATMRMLGEKFVVDWKRARKQLNPVTRDWEDIYSIKMMDNGGEIEEGEITLSNFAKLPSQQVKIIDIKSVPGKQVFGKVQETIHDYDSYGKKSRPGSTVDNVVRSLKRTFIVDFGNGIIRELEERQLNA